ncbi:MAG: universal stress protein [Gammaproteobacteria bacterium]|nr:universal stress protein [Gammaproteobacteria bacterium]
MKSINKIMVVIDANEDFSDAPDGLPIELRKALRLAPNKETAEIKLISVGYERYLSNDFRSIGYDYTKLRQEYIDRLTKTMEELVADLCADGYNISCEVGWAHPRYELIVDMTQNFGADLLIQHCRATGTVRNLHLTHDSWELVRHCPVPLLLVKDCDWGEEVVLMAAIDPLHSRNKPLHLDDQLIAAAQTIASVTGGDAHIVHAYAESARPFAAAGKIKEEHEIAFNELMANYDFDAAHKHLIDESPVDALKFYGEKINSDMVIMGAISRSRLREALVGSTAESVLDYIKTDILIIKPDSN